MAIYEVTSNQLREIQKTSFSQAGLYERANLQHLLRSQVEIISPDTLVVAEEFGEWEDSKRRIDLLGIDKNANLVVIELKRDETGGHMELQAIRYAAMVSTMTFDDTVKAFADFLRNTNSSTDARSALLNFLGENADEKPFGQNVRMVLAAAEFSKELTTAVMWLNKRDLDIRCVRIKPYSDNGRVLIDVQQVIPLPEAEDYIVHLKKKEQKERQEQTGPGPTKQLYLEYWQAFAKLLKSERSKLVAEPSPEYYIGFELDDTKWLYASVGPRASGVCATLGCWDTDFWEALRRVRNEIDQAAGKPLDWTRESEGFCEAILDMGEDADPYNRDDWPKQHAWLHEKLNLLQAVFKSRLESVGRGEDQQKTTAAADTPSP